MARKVGRQSTGQEDTQPTWHDANSEDRMAEESGLAETLLQNGPLLKPGLKLALTRHMGKQACQVL